MRCGETAVKGTFSTFSLPLTSRQPNPYSQAGVMLEPEYASFLTPHLTLPVICKRAQSPTFILLTPENISNPNFLLRFRSHAPN